MLNCNPFGFKIMPVLKNIIRIETKVLLIMLQKYGSDHSHRFLLLSRQWCDSNTGVSQHFSSKPLIEKQSCDDLFRRVMKSNLAPPYVSDQTDDLLRFLLPPHFFRRWWIIINLQEYVLLVDQFKSWGPAKIIWLPD